MDTVKFYFSVTNAPEKTLRCPMMDKAHHLAVPQQYFLHPRQGWSMGFYQYKNTNDQLLGAHS
jgi:hypothetical protein